jgi:threonine dehydrogenase-like Zn-dependent dehydrogenase
VGGASSRPLDAVQKIYAVQRIVLNRVNARSQCCVDDPLGVDSFATHTLPLAQAPHAYDIFQKKQDGAVKIILKP